MNTAFAPFVSALPIICAALAVVLLFTAAVSHRSKAFAKTSFALSAAGFGLSLISLLTMFFSDAKNPWTLFQGSSCVMFLASAAVFYGHLRAEKKDAE